jgi:hypothetical protein
MERLNLPDPRENQRPPDVGPTSQAHSDSLADLRHAYDRVSQTCEELRADLDWLAGELRSLRGHVTGGSRRKKGEEPQEPAPNGQPYTSVEQINAAIRSGTFRAR